MSVEEIREIGRRFIDEVINKQNLGAADELVTEDFVDAFDNPAAGLETGLSLEM